MLTANLVGASSLYAEPVYDQLVSWSSSNGRLYILGNLISFDEGKITLADSAEHKLIVVSQEDLT